MLHVAPKNKQSACDHRVSLRRTEWPLGIWRHLTLLSRDLQTRGDEGDTNHLAPPATKPTDALEHAAQQLDRQREQRGIDRAKSYKDQAKHHELQEGRTILGSH